MRKEPVTKGKRRRKVESRPNWIPLAAVAAGLLVPTLALAAVKPAATSPTATGAAPASKTVTTTTTTTTQAPAAATQIAKPTVAAAPVAAPAAGDLARVYTAAIALQGAVAVQDWDTAGKELDVLRGSAGTITAAGLGGTFNAIDGAVKARQAALANEHAYRMATALVTTIANRTPLMTGGGGGGGPAPEVPVASWQHLRLASQAAAQAQLALMSNDARAAKLHLDMVRDQLKGATATTHNRPLLRAIADLDKRRWRTVAALGTPQRAFANSTLLSRGLVRTLHLVGRYYAAIPASTTANVGGGGGGGATLKPSVSNTRIHQRPQAVVAPDSVPYDKRYE